MLICLSKRINLICTYDNPLINIKENQAIYQLSLKFLDKTIFILFK